MNPDPFSKLKNFFSFRNNKKNKSSNNSNNLIINQKLILNLRKQKRPKLKQLRYITKILTSGEKKIILGLSILILASLGFIGFVFASHHIQTIPSDKGEYTEGIVGFPHLINPLFSQKNDVDSDLTKLVFSGLLKYDKDLNLTPDLAASYEISEDQTLYTFHLRTDVYWHNKDKFTADDVLFTIDTIKDKDYNSPLRLTFSSVETTKIDEYTVSFKLREPYSPFLNLLTFGILPQNIWINVPPQNVALTQYNINPVGTGMYEADSFKKDKMGNIKSYTLKRNENYYNQKPHIQKLTFKFYPDFESAYLALKSKDIQGINFLPKNFHAELQDSKNVVIEALNLPQYTALFLNQEHNAVLKEKNLRLALTLGLDKNSLLEEALNNEGILIYGPILPGFIGYNPNLEKYEYKPQEANKLLDDLKWNKIDADEFIKQEKEKQEKEISEKEKKLQEYGKEEDSEEKTANMEALSKEIEELKSALNNAIDEYKLQTFYRQKDGNLLKLNLTTVNNEDNIKIANSIKEYWKNIGVFTKLNIVPAADLGKNIIAPRDYDCLLYGEILGADPDPYPFWHSSQNKHPGLNLAIFSNKEVDKLLEEARQTNDENKRKDKYVHFQNILAQEIPAIFLYSPTYSYILNKKIKDFNITKIYLPHDRFSNIQEWYTNKKIVWRW